MRQHFTKCAAFAADIQQYFKDYFGDKYETAELTDMWGNKMLAKDVLLITTDNAMKWCNKFGLSFDYWCEWVNKGHNIFGVVKTAHPSKYGSVQRMSYQMVNALNMDTMNDVMKTSFEYVDALKTDTDAFLEFLKDNANFSNDYEVLYELVKFNPKFVSCDWFLRQKSWIINKYIKKIKSGKLLQNAENLVIVLNPYGMLMYAVGEDPEQDPTFDNEDVAYQCYTERFEDGSFLAEFRSPFNSQSSLGYLHNRLDERIRKYFRLGKLCIAINGVHTAFQEKNNGLIKWLS